MWRQQHTIDTPLAFYYQELSLLTSDYHLQAREVWGCGAQVLIEVQMNTGYTNIHEKFVQLYWIKQIFKYPPSPSSTSDILRPEWHMMGTGLGGRRSQSVNICLLQVM